MFGATRELVRTCGDENPPLDFLANPLWLPRGRNRDALEASSSAESAALALMSDAVAAFRQHAEKVWLLSVAFAHSCVAEGECMERPGVGAALRGHHLDFVTAFGPLLVRLGAASSDTAWISRVGDMVHIVTRHAFSAKHLEFTSSVLSGVEGMQPEEVVGGLYDLTVRLASASCEMLAELVAHFTLTRLPLPGAALVVRRALPQFEFHGGACCRRYNVLAHLLDSLGPEPLRMVEVGVNNALTSEFLLGRYPDLTFDGVDPWIGAEAIRVEAEGRVARFGPRAQLWRGTSQEVAPQFAPRSLDLVFIDGDHSLEAVLVDLKLWRPLVRPGGLLAGHDLFNPAFEGVLEALLVHLAAEGTTELPTVHFGPDYVWWLHL